MLTSLAVLSLVYWLAVAVVAEKTVRGVPFVPVAPEEPRWPTLSIVIPARNEEQHIEKALRSKLADDYPALEVVFVNDRSTDGTGRVAEALAAQDMRLKVVHVTELPKGWLGKVHAMQRGLEACTGEWVLFSDADVELAPGSLRGVLSFAQAHQRDHVTVLPRITARGVLLLNALSAFFRVVTFGSRMWSVSDPSSSAAVGIGAFNLVRREALARTPGLEWLKMEIGDDMGLGLLLKRQGLRSQVLNGRDAVALDFYPSYGAMARGVEKNGAAAPFPVLVLTNVFLVGLEAGFFFGPGWLVLAGYVVAVGASLRLAAWFGHTLWPSFFPGVGMWLLNVAIVRSGFLALLRGGVVWRGTLYTTSEVRAGGRIGFVPSAKKT